jgi:hypothetical protein
MSLKAHHALFESYSGPKRKLDQVSGLIG